ncbi:Uncharacterised protein [uncultured archaeon]|nr:Uncharacterised protein [uncultured archaeon]
MYTLDQLCNSRTLVVDTSPLIGYLPTSGARGIIDKQVAFTFLVRKAVIEGKPIYITPRVQGEYLNPNWEKNCLRAGERRLVDCRKSLVEAFTQKDRVLSFVGEELQFYDALKGLLRGMGYESMVDDTDMDIILTALTLASRRKKKVGILTNDSGICGNSKKIFPMTCLPKEAFLVCKRVEKHQFQPW